MHASSPQPLGRFGSHIAVRASHTQARGSHGTKPPKTARQKQQALWHDICESRYQRLPAFSPPWAAPVETAKTLWRMACDPAFIRDVIDAPYTDPGDDRPDREKLFHRLGTCALGEFTPVNGLSAPGVLGTPTPVLMRLSIATVPALFAPGVAFKFFREGAWGSVNLLAAPGLDPQSENDFFARPSHTRVAPPQTALARGFFELLGKRHDPYGMDVPQALALPQAPAMATQAPSKLTFVPLVHLAQVPREHFREGLGQLPTGTPLWEVCADGQRLGQIRQTSPFVASTFGDRRLHFSHV